MKLKYYLLTGATGLLGSYLLRDLLQSDLRIAVVVRPTKGADPRQRIEDIMAHWEKQSGYWLPRPVVLEGNLSQDSLGLNSEQIDWISKHCNAVIHNAASLTFVAEDRNSEPWLSNLSGTQKVLDLCERAGIQNFFHVSTAYVCGLRNGLVRETELDKGQEFGNAYEESKLLSEKLVLESPFLEQPTVFRPGIIIGDSKTSYTSTFHGFYAPLKIIDALFDKTPPKTLESTSFLDLLGMQGTERKNFVPVDWISKIMTHVITTPENHHRTYHLTPSNTTVLSGMVDTLGQSLIQHRRMKNNGTTGTAKGFSSLDLGRFFIDQMRIYQAYWRDDPDFDRTNTLSAAPHLPCPAVDSSMLMRMCTFALNTNFGWPKTPSRLPEIDVEEQFNLHSDQHQTPANESKKTYQVGLEVTGPGGGQWEFKLLGSSILNMTKGMSDHCEATVYTNVKTLQALKSGQKTFQEIFRNGFIVLEGSEELRSNPDQWLPNVLC